MQKKSVAAPKRFGFARFTGILAVIFIAAIVISALPAFGVNAQSAGGSSYLGLGSIFGAAETTSQPAITPQSVPQPYLFAPGACDTAGPIEVESSGGTTDPTAYGTLKLAFDAINAGTHTGTITIDVCGDTTETASAVINASGSGSTSYASIAISPIGARSISGAIAGGSPLIDFNGADNVTINGLNAGGNSLTISNTTVSSTSFTSTIRFINDATNNTVQNASILGSSTAATNGGVIFFGGTNGTSGSDGNIINNNNIGPAGSSLPTNAICSLGSVTTGTHYNSGIQITGNRIFDFFNASTTSNGIFASTGSSDWTITGNSFYQTATRTATTGSTHTAIQVNYSLANNFVISNNTIGGSDATAGGTPWTQTGSFANRFVGIQFTGGSTTPSSIQNNTIKNFAWTSTSGTTTLPGIWIGIYVSTGSANVGTTTGNTIGATTGTGSVTVSTSTTGGISFGIGSVSTGTVAISNNNVGAITLNSTSATVSHPFVGIQTTAGTNTIFGNIIGSTTTANSINSTPASTSATSQSVTGILSSSSTSANISNNIVANLNNNYAGTGTGQVRGIVGTAGVLTITSNTIRNLSSTAPQTNTTSSASVIGISISPSSTSGNTISQNLVHSLSNSAASAGVQLTGIYVAPSGSAGNVIERNLVYNISTPSTGAASINGIYAFNGNSTYRNNMVRLGLDAAGNSLTSGNLAINGMLADTISASTNNYYHNSVYIGGTGVGAGTTATNAFRRITSDTSNVFNNIFVNNRSNAAGTGKHYIMNIAATTTFNSNTNVFFQNGTGGVFGIVGSTESVTFDNWKTNTGKDAGSIFGDPLFVAPTAATPDLHIQAGSPAIDQAANVGVGNDFDGETRPGLNSLFDIGADERDGIAPVANDIQATAFIDPTNGGTKAAGVSFSPQASFTNNGTSTQTNVTVRYRICTDASCATELYNQTATIASIASGATVTVTFPSTSIASPGTYTIKAKAELGTDTVPANDEITGTVIVPAPLNGTYTVGAGGNYSSLTNNGGIFQTMNTIGVSGPVTIEIATNLSGETGTHALNANSGNFSVTIKPQTGVTPTITGSSSGCLIALSGADNVTIDGSNTVNGTTRDLTITNTNSGTSSAVVCLQTSTTGGLGATNNTVKNTNIVGNSSTTTLFGIFSGSSTVSLSSTGTDNDNNTILNNAVSKAQYGIFSQGASAANKNQGTTISQNSLDATGANAIGRTGILVGFENNVQITQNSIDGIASAASSQDEFGISLGIQVILNTTFTGNEVTNATVSRNIVGTVRQTATYSACGICVAPATSGTNLIVNNMIYGVSSNGTSGDFGAGMFIGGGLGSTTQIYFNSISMTGTQTGGSEESYALAIGGSNPVVDIKNNILYNTQDNGTGNNYAIGLGYGSPFTNLVSDYNDFFVTSPSAEHHVGATGSVSAPTSRTTLNDWQTITGKDANSKNVDPLFTSTTSLYLQFGSPVLSMGTPIAGITTDISGDTRQTPPDIGADEITSIAGTFDFNPTTYNPNEGDGTVTLTVTRTGGDANLPVDVAYTLADGTATGGASCMTAGVDYVNAGGSVSFAAGESSKNISVTICDDSATESSETFTATLNTASNNGIIGSNNTATVTITDNDVISTPGTIQFSATGYSVGEGGANAVLTVTRTGGSNGMISANYSLTNGTATGGASCATTGVDFVNTGGSVSFDDGDTASKTIQVPICDDSLFESSEAFTATLSGAAVGSPASAEVTINDNDTQPSIQFAASTATSGEGAGTVMLEVTRTGATANAVGASYTLADSGATGGASCATTGVDYINTGNTVSFAAGETSKNITVTICDDSLYESGTEAFIATLSTPTGNAVIGTPSANTVTITDNDTQPSVQFSMSNFNVAENVAGGLATINVTRSGATGNAVSVNYATVSGGTATGNTACGAGVDYINTSGTLNFAAGDASKSFTVQICDDGAFEGNETVNLQLSAPTGATLGSQSTATLTIQDDESPQSGTIQFSSMIYSIGENGTNATLTVTRTGGSNGTVSANYTLSDGTATGGASCATTGVDYINTGDTVSFGDGDTADKTITVPICDDSAFEGDETFTATLSGANVGTPSSATVTITENDSAPTVQFSSSTYMITEGLTGGGDEQVGVVNPTVTITVTRSGNTAGTSSVNYATSDGTATGGATCSSGVDYRSTSGTLNFAAGETSKTFSVETCVDLTTEGNETVNLTLSAPSLATLGMPNTAVLTITDNDAPPSATVQFSAAAYETNEAAGSVTITVTRSGDTSGSSSVNFATVAGGSATGGSCQAVGYDYETKSGTLNFGAGETSKTFSFQICADIQSENPPETVNLQLSTPSGATLGSQSTAKVNIIDAAVQFRNSTPVIIPEESPTLADNLVGQASTSINVSGAGINPNRVRVTLFGFTHTSPDDLDILLVSPTGQKFVLMGDAGGTNAANNLTLTFENAAGTPVPDASTLMSGNYKPANHEAVPDFAAPAPTGPYVEPGTTGNGANINTTFSGNPNGTWTLYLRDDTVNGNTGTLAGGFGLELIAPTAATVTVSGRVTRPNGQGVSNAVISLAGATGFEGRRYALTNSFGYYTIENVPAGEVYIISVNAKRYTFSTPSRAITVLDSLTDVDFVSQQ